MGKLLNIVVLARVYPRGGVPQSMLADWEELKCVVEPFAGSFPDRPFSVSAG